MAIVVRFSCGKIQMHLSSRKWLLLIPNFRFVWTLHLKNSSRALAAIVLVHGGFVDGSGWEGVYKILKKDGYAVSVVQNGTVTLADDVATTKRVVDAQTGPVILVGHSYGGAVITEAGNNPKVAGLVYVTAFAPDAGESVSTLDRKSVV